MFIKRCLKQLINRLHFFALSGCKGFIRTNNIRDRRALATTRRFLQQKNRMNMVRHNHILIDFQGRISLLQQQQLLLCDSSICGILDFGGSKPPPYDMGQQASSVLGADGNKIRTGGTVIVVRQTGVFSFRQVIFHKYHQRYYTAKSAGQQCNLRIFWLFRSGLARLMPDPDGTWRSR